MKKNNIIIISITTLIILISLIINTSFYKSLTTLVVYAEKDSYALKYATKEQLPKKEIAESKKDNYELHVEAFDYDINNEEIELKTYYGVSKELIIPKTIANKKITKINESLFDNEKIQTIIISENIKELDLGKNNIKVKCYDNKYCNELKKNYKNITILNDSKFYNFNNSDLEYGYKLSKDKITITEYNGDDKFLIIPSTINGYKVVEIDMDAFKLQSIYIPKTIEEINSDLTSKTINTYLITIILISVCSLLLVITLILLVKEKNLTETVYNIPQYLLTIIYVLLIVLQTNAIKVNPFTYNTTIIKTIVISLIYTALMLLLKFIKKTNKDFDKKLKETGTFIKQASGIIKDLNKKELEEVLEEIKYSDPVSTEEVVKIEEDIIKLLNEINDENISDKKEEVLKLVKKRNRIIKESK